MNGTQAGRMDQQTIGSYLASPTASSRALSSDFVSSLKARRFRKPPEVETNPLCARRSDYEFGIAWARVNHFRFVRRFRRETWRSESL